MKKTLAFLGFLFSSLSTVQANPFWDAVTSSKSCGNEHPFTKLPRVFEPSEDPVSPHMLFWQTCFAFKATQHNPVTLQKELSSYGFLETEFVYEGPNLKAFIVSQEKDLVIGFRGSQTIYDWAFDVFFWDKAYPEGFGKVHTGFWMNYLISRNKIINTVVKQYKGQKIYISGHSLGGTQAHFLALDLQKRGIPVAGIYTFASPKTGNQEFSKYYNDYFGDKTYTLYHPEDIVPHLPPSDSSEKHFKKLFMPQIRDLAEPVFQQVDYHHVGQSINFKNKAFEENNDDLFWEKAASKAQAGIFFDLFWHQPENALRHLPGMYMRIAEYYYKKNQK